MIALFGTRIQFNQINSSFEFLNAMQRMMYCENRRQRTHCDGIEGMQWSQIAGAEHKWQKMCAKG